MKFEDSRGSGGRGVSGEGMRISGLRILAVIGAALLAALALAGLSPGARADAPMFPEEGTPPPGANVACEPTAEHPYPVILVHGTFETMAQNWSVLSPLLKAESYCVFTLNYGSEGEGNDAQGMGLGPVQESARDLDAFVDDVLDYTGAQKVQLVGHSQGGMMPRYWIKNLGGAPLVEDLVGIAPSNYGTNLNDGGTPLPGQLDPCTACTQQNADSSFIKKLNEGDDTPGDGSFTQIATDDDEIIIPFTNTFLKGERLTENIVIQNYNDGLLVTHQNIYNDPTAQRFTLEALDNPGPALDPEGRDDDTNPGDGDGGNGGDGGDGGDGGQASCTITGTQRNDNLRGTSGRDVVCGLGGNDVLRGFGGNDVLRGGAGNDALYGGPGDDALYGASGNDALYGEGGRDTLDGGSGRNSIRQ